MIENVPPRDTPIGAYIELTSHCNFKCVFCPSETMNRKKCNLPYEIGEKFLKSIYREYGTSVYVCFQVLGEPFINSDIFKYLEMCEQLGILAVINTNISLLNDSVCKKLFAFNRFMLVLSLQTPNEQSYLMRGYQNLTFSEYIKKVDEVLGYKFKYKSDCAIQIHVANTYYTTNHDQSVTVDVTTLPNNPLFMFDSDKEEHDWHWQYVQYLEELGRKIKGKYKENYEELCELDNKRHESDIKKGRIITDYVNLPDKFYQRSPDDVFEFYMPMPNVLYIAKGFGLFTKEEHYLRQIYDLSKYFVHVEEKHGSETCELANSIGVLANGDLICCCLDIEGDIKLGNMREDDIDSPKIIARWQEIKSNVLNEKLCRRCRGYVVVSEKMPLECTSQKIVHFNLDWHWYEQDLYGKGGRWSKELSTVFIYARIDASCLKLDANSLRKDMSCKMKIYRRSNNYWVESDTCVFTCSLGENAVEVAYSFEKGEFYKVEIICPTLNTQEIYGSEHSRHLGIAVTDMWICD